MTMVTVVIVVTVVTKEFEKHCFKYVVLKPSTRKSMFSMNEH